MPAPRRYSASPISRYCAEAWSACSEPVERRTAVASRARNIPPALEETVRRWVETGQEVDGLLEAISQECLQTFLVKKEEVLARKRKEKPP